VNALTWDDHVICLGAYSSVGVRPHVMRQPPKNNTLEPIAALPKISFRSLACDLNANVVAWQRSFLSISVGVQKYLFLKP